MKILQNAVEKAAAELAKLQKARVELERGLIADEARLVEQRAQAADVELAALLDEVPAQESGSLPVPKIPRPNVAALEAIIEARRRARPKLLERLRTSIKALAHERAEVLRKQAAKKRLDLDEYAAERARRLKALEEFTGARWLVDVSFSGATLLGAVSIRTGAPAPADKGVLLSAEIDDLKRQAADIEAAAAGACEGGALAGDSLEALLSDAEKRPLGPLPSAIQRWFEETEARETTAWEQQYPEGLFRAPTGSGEWAATPATRQTAYTLVWDRDGAIDRKRSGAVSSLGPLVDGGEVGAAVPLQTYVYRSA